MTEPSGDGADADALAGEGGGRVVPESMKRDCKSACSSCGVGGRISRPFALGGEDRSTGFRSIHPRFMAWLSAADRMARHLRMLSGDKPAVFSLA